MSSGVLCVTIFGMHVMQELFADSLVLSQRLQLGFKLMAEEQVQYIATLWSVLEMSRQYLNVLLALKHYVLKIVNVLVINMM